jgi:putative endonuclease
MREGRGFESLRSRHFKIKEGEVFTEPSFYVHRRIMPYVVYILKSLKDQTYYVGSTQDLESRLKRHNQGRVAYTKPKRPWKLVYSEEHPDRSSAAKRETEIKTHKRRGFIEALIKNFKM